MNSWLNSVKESVGTKSWAGWPRMVLRGAIDQVYPPICLVCNRPVVESEGLCASCWRGLHPITEPMCPVLGLPFEVSLGPEARSAEAIASPPPFDRARAAFVYNDMARRLVSKLKYGDRPELAKFCATAMVRACAEIISGDAVLLPVPLHPVRQWQRRYNQSAELCRALSRVTGLKMLPQLANRKRRTRQQVGLSAEQRARNVAGAFKVASDGLALTGGQRVIIVDDVVTTGATVKALARALKRSGVDQIDVISFARVVIGAEMPI